MRLRLSPREGRALVKATGKHGPTLAALGAAAADRFERRTALVVDGEAWSFEALWHASEAAAAHLFDGPLARTPRAIVAACEGAALPIAVLAAGRLGLDAWLVDPRRDAEYGLVVPSDALLVHSGNVPEWHRGPSIAAEHLLSAALSPTHALAPTRRHGRIVLLTARSGGPAPHVTRPFGVKGLQQLRGLHQRVGISGTDTVLGFSRLAHTHGLQLFAASLLTGATLVSAPDTGPDERLALMRSRGATIASGVPADFAAMLDVLDASGEAVPPLRRIVSMREPMSPQLFERLHAAWGPIVMNAYGTTEAGTVTIAQPEDLEREPGTVGRALPGSAVGIVGHRGKADAEGRVWVRGGSRTVITDDRGRIRDGLLTITGSFRD